MRRDVCWLSLLVGFWLLCAPSLGFGEEQAPTPEQVKFFETNVRPVLANHCYKCHGAEKQKGDLRLDSATAILKGGLNGPSVIPGKADDSLLIKAISHNDADLKMPPDEKLSDRQIADLTKWVKMGAPYPRDAAVQANPAKGIWSFQPIASPDVPEVKDAAWAKSPLDRFVLAKLEAAGLKLVAPADKRTLIRRATFDLTGLPPTLKEIDAFLADESPDSFARVVERLLESPHYGERWGRHWLDVARYADSNGLDENIAMGNAYRYRDYVVSAFNKDKPYDQFLLEQIAGDLLPAGKDLAVRNERLIATSFLAIGPKVLAEVDEQKMEMDIIDEQIDTLGRSVLGLTLGCARCHNHKFDPIETEDYYALAGIFKSTRVMEHFKKIARWHENSLANEQELAQQTAHQKQVDEKNAEIQKVVAAANEKLKAMPQFAEKLPDKPETMYPDETKAELKKSRDALAELQKAAPIMPTAMGVAEGTVADVPIHIRGSHLTLGKVVPRRFPAALVSTQNLPKLDVKQSGRLQLAEWLVNNDHPLTSRVFVNRIWRWHFGSGLVRSPDNFGKLGEAPTNPQLLDWLARSFIQNRWSIKALHRTIMLSQTYQSSSAYDEHNAAADPENQLYWRMNVRRLEAEELRDSLLAVSGLLDTSMGGSMLHVKNREFLFDHTSIDVTKYDSKRRSLYLPVIRNNTYDVFQLFDFADAATLNGDRATTTVALQALFFMNSDLVAQASDGVADYLRNDQSLADDKARIGQLYLLALGRPVTDVEQARATALLDKLDKASEQKVPDPTQRRREAWSWLCQVVLSSNEFVYVK